MTPTLIRAFLFSLIDLADAVTEVAAVVVLIPDHQRHATGGCSSVVAAYGPGMLEPSSRGRGVPRRHLHLLRSDVTSDVDSVPLPLRCWIGFQVSRRPERAASAASPSVSF